MAYSDQNRMKPLHTSSSGASPWSGLCNPRSIAIRIASPIKFCNINEQEEIRHLTEDIPKAHFQNSRQTQTRSREVIHRQHPSTVLVEVELQASKQQKCIAEASVSHSVRTCNPFRHDPDKASNQAYRTASAFIAFRRKADIVPLW